MSIGPGIADSFRNIRAPSVRSGERCAVFWFCAVLVIAYIGSVPAAHANQATDDKSTIDDHADAASQALIDANPQRDAEVQCLALNIYFEARSEPESGQRAVGHVVMNRVAHSGYPDSVCEVVQQGGEERLHRCQFSWWCDGQSDRPLHRKAWGEAQRLAREIYDGISKDTTDGALWYHATYVKPYWSELLLKGNKIGQHIFYLEHRRDAETL